MKKILVLCPTRGRPDTLATFIKSVRDTSTEADICLYIDDDDWFPYEDLDAIVMRGPRIGPAPAMNKMIEAHPGYEVYGAATDDCRFTTPGWDKWVLGVSQKFPMKIGMIAPHSMGSGRMDFPWATAEWIKALGWFTYPPCYHYYWDVVVEELAKSTHIVYASDEEFNIEHDAHTDNFKGLMMYKDARHAVCWLAFYKYEHLALIQGAIHAGLDNREAGAGAAKADQGAPAQDCAGTPQ
jgi:glycosyltransferase involved in cell wall biosynthesis